MPLRIYVSGPMSGYPGFNFSAFDAARDYLTRLGYEVYSPADFDRASYPQHDFSTGDLPDGWDIQKVLANDFIEVCKSDAIYLLTGWEDSSGGKQELSVALAAGKKVIVQ